MAIFENENVNIGMGLLIGLASGVFLVNKIQRSILSSAGTIGMIGTLRLATDFSSYDIEAKILGVDMGEIRQYVEEERVYNSVWMIICGVGLVLGLWWVKSGLKDKKKKRVALEKSLLDSLKNRKYDYF